MRREQRTEGRAPLQQTTGLRGRGAAGIRLPTKVAGIRPDAPARTGQDRDSVPAAQWGSRRTPP